MEATKFIINLEQKMDLAVITPNFGSLRIEIIV